MKREHSKHHQYRHQHQCHLQHLNHPKIATPLKSGTVNWLLLFCLIFPSFLYAAPYSKDIQREYQVLAPYSEQIAKRIESSRQVVNYILKNLKQRSLPEQFVLVPMLESSYNSQAVSHANAAGLWQLIPATATRFGLEVTSEYDERFDKRASTLAAIDYLTFLYNKFGQDMALTLAAYNAGEGRVMKAINKADSSQFSQLELPKETRQYVSRFYALEQLIDIKQIKATSFQPILLFSSTSNFNVQPLIAQDRLPPLIKL